MGKHSASIEILPVTPWLKFVPALNADTSCEEPIEC
jgi:hypothetical protein